MTKEDFKKVRVSLNITQKEIAKLIGKSIRSAHHYERGTRQIPEHVELMLNLIKKNTVNFSPNVWG